MAERMKLPAGIEKLVAGKAYETDNIGMSGATIWMFEKEVLKIGKTDESFERMIHIMKWANGKLPVPEIIHCEHADGKTFLLMSKVEGKMSCDEYYLNHPGELVQLLADGLKLLWGVDVSDCPCVRNQDRELEEARYRVENNLVDVDNVEPDTFGENGFESPAALLKWLEENRPTYEPVFSHGDYCLPNVFIKDGKISGFIDLGDAGIGDKWRDIALCYRSLKHNFDGTYGGKVYEDFCPDILFEKLGLEPDWEKLRYYILLDELF